MAFRKSMFSNPETQIAEHESGVPFEQRQHHGSGRSSSAISSGCFVLGFIYRLRQHSSGCHPKSGSHGVEIRWPEIPTSSTCQSPTHTFSRLQHR
ncbi:hypothetical protein ACLOJK_000618 [Asimina triloba]